MFLKEKIKNNNEKEQVNNLNTSFSKFLNKEEEIIRLLDKAELSSQYMSMLILKINFAKKDAENILKDIEKTSMDSNIKLLHMQTANTFLKRLENLKLGIIEINTNLKTNDILSKKLQEQKMLDKLTKDFKKE